VIGETIGGTLRNIESKTFAASPSILDKIPAILIQMREQMEAGSAARNKGINIKELDYILRKAFGSEPYVKQPSVQRLFKVLDSDGDGLLTPLQVSSPTLCSHHLSFYLPPCHLTHTTSGFMSLSLPPPSRTEASIDGADADLEGCGV